MTRFNCPAGVHVLWSAVNQAFLVMWHETILSIETSRDDVRWYLDSIRGSN